MQRFWQVGRLQLEPWLADRIARDTVHLWPRAEPAAIDSGPGEAVTVTLGDGTRLETDHVLLATGYRVDMRRVPYLPDDLELADGFPVLDEDFQTSLAGLYVPGFPSTRDFGPFFGFVAGRHHHRGDHRRRAGADTILRVVISTNQFKNGNHIDVEGTIFKIIEFQHVKPGKGGAFVRTKLRRAADGAVIDRTFRAGEKFRSVHTEARKMQFLYSDGTDAHFMDSESYEQIALPEESVQEPLQWIRPNETVDLLYIDDQPGDIQLAASVELEVTHTEPGMRGDTASGGGTKPATLETGATVSVPLFVNIGDRVKVDTRSGSYMSRA